MAGLVLIGPIAAGKSSVAERLAERTGLRQIPLDAVRWYYYFQIGFDLAEQKRREREDGPLGRFAYWKPFEAYAVERALADFPDSIIDFGAGHSVQDDEALFARVKAALAPVPHVILLLPSPDVEEAVRILSERVPPDGRDEVAELNRGFLTNPSNARLATTTVYTGRRSPEEVCEEILVFIGRRLDS